MYKIGYKYKEIYEDIKYESLCYFFKMLIGIDFIIIYI